jgi:hypothetical protein
MSWGGGGIDASSASTSKEDNWIVYSSGKKAVEKVIVHPLVLLSVTDHYNRVAKDTKKRVVGILLGEVSHGECHVTNSYAGTCRVADASRTQRPRDAFLSNKRLDCLVFANLKTKLVVLAPSPPQFLSRRRAPSGSWTTCTTKTCSSCSKRSTVSVYMPLLTLFDHSII